MFHPKLDILPPAQKNLWPKLAEVPRSFVLYGGTGLALRLGHRVSMDFDFFSSEAVLPEALLNSLALLKGAKVLQSASQTLTVAVNPDSPVKLSFFGGISFGRVGAPELTSDGVLNVASLLDIAGTKAAVVYQRAESKDYLDILALVQSGISLPHMIVAARALYGEQYNPLLTLKSLVHFGDGDLFKLNEAQKAQLIEIAANPPLSFPTVNRISNRLSPDEDTRANSRVQE